MLVTLPASPTSLPLLPSPGPAPCLPRCRCRRLASRRSPFIPSPIHYRTLQHPSINTLPFPFPFPFAAFPDIPCLSACLPAALTISSTPCTTTTTTSTQSPPSPSKILGGTRRREQRSRLSCPRKPSALHDMACGSTTRRPRPG
ncbi:hypothetical protein E2C01_030526 [Portunus trituberculatus]|uniref:Uncharacterized protein n=1 Tax=Portunus trituberculatus TaxID=210409 RepID=A0A5B7EVZ6_PORTR|nr:hypothetical protein [Portunus trituberculatus]